MSIVLPGQSGKRLARWRGRSAFWPSRSDGMMVAVGFQPTEGRRRGRHRGATLEARHSDRVPASLRDARFQAHGFRHASLREAAASRRLDDLRPGRPVNPSARRPALREPSPGRLRRASQRPRSGANRRRGGSEHLRPSPGRRGDEVQRPRAGSERFQARFPGQEARPICRHGDTKCPLAVPNCLGGQMEPSVSHQKVLDQVIEPPVSH